MAWNLDKSRRRGGLERRMIAVSGSIPGRELISDDPKQTDSSGADNPERYGSSQSLIEHYSVVITSAEVAATGAHSSNDGSPVLGGSNGFY